MTTFSISLISIAMIIAIVVLISWVWALMDCQKRDFSNNELTLWTLLIVFFPVLGTIAYVIGGRPSSDPIIE